MNIFNKFFVKLFSFFKKKKEIVKLPIHHYIPYEKILNKNNRILITAKNIYQIGQNLRGTLNDANNYHSYFLELGFDPSCFKILLDKDATGENERAALKWLGECTGCYAVYINSGHGIISEDNHEATACYDFNFDNDNGLIKSIEVKNSLKDLPKITKLIIINDACHSENDLLKDLSKGIPKTIYNPRTRRKNINNKQDAKAITDEMLDCVYFGGCKKDQTSTDAEINGVNCGAMSYFWLKNIKKLINPIAKELNKVNTNDLKINGYKQKPTCEGSKKLENLF